ncbi:MAG: hypothetical protein HKN07_16455 [Acidimicrobiia bacterium]|nr:hypothetical protein [Acidimicrobiia bacterium]
MATLFVACGNDATGPSSAAPVVSNSEAVPGGDETTEDVAASTSLPAVPAGQYLEDALHGRAAGYGFATVITADGQLATVVSGSVVGTASEVVVSTGGVDLSYLSTPDGRWVKGEDGLWTELDSDPGGVPPLASLEGPLTADYVVAEGNVVVVRATYPGSILGAPELEEVTIDFEIADGRLVVMRYEATVGDIEVTSETELVDADPTVEITVPPVEG